MKLKSYKRTVIYLIDLLLLLLAIFLSFILRFEFDYKMATKMLVAARNGCIMFAITFSVFYFVLGSYKKTWSTISADDELKILKVNGFSTLVIYILLLLEILPFFPLSVLVITFLFASLMQSFIRIFYGLYKLSYKERKKGDGHPVFIYGGGSAGRIIVKELMDNPRYNYYVKGIIDDDYLLHNTNVLGKKVLGGLKVVEAMGKKHGVSDIIFAIPSINEVRKKEILNELVKHGFQVKVVRSSESLLLEPNLRRTLRSVDEKDLLNRPEINSDNSGLLNTIKGKVVLVTGAGGSIGSELVRQISKYSPKQVIMVDISETGVYAIQQEMNILRNSEVKTDVDPNIEYKALITSIRDRQSLDQIFSTYRPEYVFHAAAHKHVPLMEELPKEAIKNNIFGTHNVVKMCIKYNVVRMVNVSTDKAVNPTNVMGASKRFNEKMIQAYNSVSKTQFVAVRFGNVLGSNGSVIPLFKKQIESGGPITLTHPDITRFFMTIPEAVSLILQASVFAKGGEIFVLDMGQPVKILHLAEQLIRLSGLEPYEDIDIQFIGLRPGEKLYEELLMDEEGLEKTNNALIHIAKPLNYEVEWIQEALQAMDSCLELSNEEVLNVIRKYVKTYNPNG